MSDLLATEHLLNLENEFSDASATPSRLMNHGVEVAREVEVEHLAQIKDQIEPLVAAQSETPCQVGLIVELVGIVADAGGKLLHAPLDLLSDGFVAGHGLLLSDGKEILPSGRIRV
jgi:hypothetical protein